MRTKETPMFSMLLVIANLLVGSSGFSVSVVGGIHCRENTSLFAKAAKKKSKSKAKASGSGGGFGKVAESAPNKVVDDYAVFPALEQQVEDTLIPSPAELQEAGALPVEVYDRLEKIYGFPNFNFQTSEEDDEGGSSSSATLFEDLISASPSQSKSAASTTSQMSDLDFADLLSSATGDEPTTAPKVVVDSKMEAIASLPQFSEFRVLHVDPLVLAIDDFFTDEECDRYVAMSSNPTTEEDDSPYETRSKTVGKDKNAKSQRTSTTWFHNYKNVPELISKASRLLGLDRINQWEEPQIVR
jgi:hypothetical protein